MKGRPKSSQVFEGAPWVFHRFEGHSFPNPVQIGNEEEDRTSEPGSSESVFSWGTIPFSRNSSESSVAWAGKKCYLSCPDVLLALWQQCIEGGFTSRFLSFFPSVRPRVNFRIRVAQSETRQIRDINYPSNAFEVSDDDWKENKVCQTRISAQSMRLVRRIVGRSRQSNLVWLASRLNFISSIWQK